MGEGQDLNTNGGISPEQEAAEKAHERAEKAFDRAIESAREYYKIQLDFFKHMATVSGAATVAVTAVIGATEPETIHLVFLGVAVFLFTLSALFAVMALRRVTDWVDEVEVIARGDVPTDVPAEEATRKYFAAVRLWRGRVYLFFALGIAALSGGAVGALLSSAFPLGLTYIGGA